MTVCFLIVQKVCVNLRKLRSKITHEIADSYYL